jgi:hypothetical protein
LAKFDTCSSALSATAYIALAREERLLLCLRGYWFDVARSGYINLLQPPGVATVARFAMRMASTSRFRPLAQRRGATLMRSGSWPRPIASCRYADRSLSRILAITRMNAANSSDHGCEVF